MRTLVIGVSCMAANGATATGAQPGAPGACGVVRQFNEAMNRQDHAGVLAFVADDFVFENTNPPPDGARVEGKAAYGQWLQKWFAANPGATFDTEEQFDAGNRCVVRWVYRKVRDGQPWHLRGIDEITVTGGKLVAKRSYVKG